MKRNFIISLFLLVCVIFLLGLNTRHKNHPQPQEETENIKNIKNTELTELTEQIDYNDRQKDNPKDNFPDCVGQAECNGILMEVLEYKIFASPMEFMDSDLCNADYMRISREWYETCKEWYLDYYNAFQVVYIKYRVTNQGEAPFVYRPVENHIAYINQNGYSYDEKLLGEYKERYDNVHRKAPAVVGSELIYATDVAHPIDDKNSCAPVIQAGESIVLEAAYDYSVLDASACSDECTEEKCNFVTRRCEDYYDDTWNMYLCWRTKEYLMYEQYFNMNKESDWNYIMLP